jgi:VanZ family protein
VAREFALILREAGMLRAVIAACFGAAFLGIAWYVTLGVRISSIRAWVGLALVAGVLGLALAGLNTPEERIHFLEFGVLALLVRRCLAADYPVKLQYVLSVLITAGMGAGDEILQAYLPDRFFDVRDIVINVAAGLLAIAGYEYVHGNLEKDAQRENGPDAIR